MSASQCVRVQVEVHHRGSEFPVMTIAVSASIEYLVWSNQIPEWYCAAAKRAYSIVRYSTIHILDSVYVRYFEIETFLIRYKLGDFLPGCKCDQYTPRRYRETVIEHLQ